MVKLIYFLFLLYYLPAQSVLADGIIKELSLPTSQGKTLNVTSDCGDVNISTWNKDEAYVKITGNDNAKEKMEFNIEEKNGDIYISIKKSSGIKFLENTNLKIDVSIPEKFNTDIATAGGDISLGSLTGNVEMKTAGGDIVLKNISGKAELKTAGGDIRVESSNGNIEANTAGGNININGSNGNIEAKTAGGDITVNYTGENKGIELKTAGGDIRLYLSDDVSANINLRTSSGDIKMGFEYKGETNKSKTKIEGTINGGGNTITCKTSGG
ncbi:MAG: DUF4097 family beta strand repeat-containing protein, partial [Ignavibacteriae bacterium]|nr:DUF4097 family beta strand repeat-containing protein [Ignavibacteriota bacterium]